MSHTTSRFTGGLLTLGAGLALLGGATPGAAQEATPPPTTLVEAVRQATAPFPDPAAAEAAGYVPMQGCVSGPQDGAMGLHYVNADLVGQMMALANYRANARAWQAANRMMDITVNLIG